jgi:hypothetical protein
MQQASVLKCVLTALGITAIAAFVGCAEGTDPGAYGVSDLATLPLEAGAGDENSVVLPPSTQPKEEESTGDDAGVPDMDAGGGGVDAGGTPDAGGGGGGGGGGTSCASANVCAGATDLGTISGDTGSDSKTAQGTGSYWFTVRVTENDSSISPLTLLTKAELTSPPGTNFDLFVYVASGGSGQECSAVKASSTNASGLDTAKAEWGETGIFSNGSSDDRTVTVEVRWISGTCSAATPWTLTVYGNTP